MTLSRFGAEVRDTLVAIVPEVGPHVMETTGGDLLVVVPHPRIESGLYLSTKNGEITVGFAEWHEHHELLGEPTEVRAEEVARYIRSILDGGVTLVIRPGTGPSGMRGSWIWRTQTRRGATVSRAT